MEIGSLLALLLLFVSLSSLLVEVLELLVLELDVDSEAEDGNEEGKVVFNRITISVGSQCLPSVFGYLLSANVFKSSVRIKRK